MAQESANRAYRRVRLQTLIAYGGKCACCGEDYEPFLAIDHVEGGGSVDHRRSGSMYSRLRRQGWPSGYQILCFNCNWRKGKLSECDCQQKEDRQSLQEMLDEMPDNGHHGWENDGSRKGERLTIVCAECEKTFEQDGWTARRSRAGSGPFCSRECFNGNRRKVKKEG